MTRLPYLLPWVRVLSLIRSITSTDWDDTTGRLVQPRLGDAPADRTRGLVELNAAGGRRGAVQIATWALRYDGRRAPVWRRGSW